MRKQFNSYLLLAAILILALSPPFSDAAEGVLKVKAVTMITTGTPGGTTDTMGRIVGRFLSNHLPGKPRIIVRNISRGSELIDFNYLYERGRKDGSEMGASSTRVTMGELVSLDIRRYDLAKMPLIAAFPDGVAPILNTKLVPDGWKGMIRMGDKFIAGGSGPESLTNWAFMWFKKWLNPDMKIIFGYEKGTARTALLRGESHMLNESTPSAVQYWSKEPGTDVPFTCGALDDHGNVVRDPLLPISRPL
jgi:tripartite-type tricarboxylate transporter receptor subunit TctC